jgi:hypothetical protein
MAARTAVIFRSGDEYDFLSVVGSRHKKEAENCRSSQ